MHDSKRRITLGAGVALLALSGCFNFDEAFQTCVSEGRCPVVVDAGPPAPPVGIFVDPAAGKDTNPGTRDSPFLTLSAALNKTDAGTEVYLARGTYVKAGGWELTQPFTIRGGFTGVEGGWVATTDRSELSGGDPALTVRNLGDQAITLDKLAIKASNATAAGEASIGMRVLASQAVTLNLVDIQAGDGMAGEAGEAGGAAAGAGSDGSDGGPGQPGTGTGSRALGGSGSSTACGPTGSGGNGGGGGINDPSGNGEAGQPGSPSSALGGDGGLKDVDSNPTCGMTPCMYSAETGRNGADGGVGDEGSPGDAGGWLGKVNSTGMWVADVAGSGWPESRAAAAAAAAAAASCSSTAWSATEPEEEAAAAVAVQDRAVAEERGVVHPSRCCWSTRGSS